MKTTTNTQSRVRRGAGLLLSAVLGLTALPSSAAVTAGASEGTGVDASLTSLSLLTFLVGPDPHAEISSPTVGTLNDMQLNLNESLGLGTIAAENGGDDALVVSASSDVTGLNVTGLASGTSTINNLELTVVEGVLLTPDLLTLTSTTLGSTSTTSGSQGALTSMGTSELEGLAISVAGVSITVPLNPSPNTTLDLSATGVAGLSIVLNEQIESGDGASSSGIITNAVHIVFDAVSFGGVSAIDGDIILGHSQSSLAAVPEPGVAGLVALVPFLALLRRRGRERSAKCG